MQKYFILILTSAMLTLGLSSHSHAQNNQIQNAYNHIREEATRLAGKPEDTIQRIIFLHQIYIDSNGNHTFPAIALHGALWAKGFFDVTGPIAKAVSLRYFYDSQEKERRLQMLETFSLSFKDANRSVFIDTYTNYYFSKLYGHTEEARNLIHHELLESLNLIHEKSKDNSFLSGTQKKTVFMISLLWEQEQTVSPKVVAAVEKFDCPILKTFSLKPIVRFAYFPFDTFFIFSNFSDKKERIEKAERAYDIAEEVGWLRVSDSIMDYGILPEEFIADPLRYAKQLKSKILNHN